MSKKYYLAIVLVLVLSFSTKALASLTFSADAITGTGSSTLDVGAGNALNIQTVGNGTINTGTGLFTAGGNLAVAGTTSLTGHVGIAATPNANYTLYLNESVTDPTQNKYGIFSALTQTGNTSAGNNLTGVAGLVTDSGSSASTAGTFTGLAGTAFSNSGSNITFSPGLVGISAGAYTFSSTGTVAKLMGVYVHTWGAYTAGNTVTDARGIQINSPTTGGTVANAYGLYINNITGATTNNYAIYSAGGKSYFGGDVAIGTLTPNANALLDLSSTTKAFMPPRMTTAQRNAIPSPTAGMVIYNSETNKLNVYTTTWEVVTSS